VSVPLTKVRTVAASVPTTALRVDVVKCSVTSITSELAVMPIRTRKMP
jgi:hypothetical protein